MIIIALFYDVGSIEGVTTIAIPGADKLVHFLLFAVHAYLVERSINELDYSSSLLKTVLISGIFAIGTEWGQSMTSYRHGDIWDIIADFAGIGVMLSILYTRRHV